MTKQRRLTAVIEREEVEEQRDESLLHPVDQLRAAGVTAREAEILALLGEGLTNQEIADRVFLSARTIERHLANVASKVGARTRSELVALAARATSV